MITIKVNNLYSSLEGHLSEDALDKIGTACSYTPKGIEYSTLVRDGRWDGSKKLFRRRSQVFPTGLMSIVRNVLESCGEQYAMVDCRVEPRISEIPVKSSPRAYQEDAVNAALDYGRGTIKGGCGAGKTNIMEFIISKTNLPTLVVTHTSTVFNQTVKRFERDFGFTVGIIGNGKWEYDKRITVGLTASLMRFDKKPELREFLSKVSCLLVDECHHISSSSFVSISEACINAYYRVGLSATPWRDDYSDLLIQAHTGRRLIDISASYLIKLGYLSRPTIKFVHFKHERQSRELKYKKLYTKEVVINEKRNALISWLAARHMRRGQSVLVSVNRVDHGEILELGIEKEFGSMSGMRCVNGDDHPDELAQTLVDLHNKKLICVIATSVYKEGVDIPSLDVLINCKAEDSSVAAYQTVGRALRRSEGKDSVLIYDIFDEGTRWLTTHSKNREEIYRTEPEFIIEHCIDKAV